ncbi:MAG: hypothetical protein E6R03_14015 [Hyphomicrobiaceae bacterium]|nr:MAG: hypothetical protein E6R03_14015 [Hyphomicrobiaceae bacterium]
MRVSALLTLVFLTLFAACADGISTKCQGSNCGIVGGSTDLSPAGPAYGCAGKFGFKPEPNPQSTVWACPGEFAPGVVRQRCAAGFHLCGGQPLVTEYCSYTNPLWKDHGAFVFEALASDATQERGGEFDPKSLKCDWSNTTGRRLIGSCGAIAWQYADTVQGNNCGQIGGFFNTCWLAGPDGVYPQNAWRCPAAPGSGDADFEMLSNKNALAGVLCCPN